MSQSTQGLADEKSTGSGPGLDPEHKPARSMRWLSEGLATLMSLQQSERVFDAIVVGSGYGGAVAALAIAKKGLRVAVLERGHEYLPGMFPSRVSDIGTHVRFATPGATHARGYLGGLFDFRVGPDMQVLVANGLGGGSLINAGVMLEPSPEVWAHERWPAAIRNDNTLRDPANDLLAELGAKESLTERSKDQVMRRMGGTPVPVTVVHTSGQDLPLGSPPMTPCIGCGDCASGCNHEAKLSLDVTLLARARRAGARLITGATVLRVQRTDSGKSWMLELTHTHEALRRREGASFTLTAPHVVLAAGTLGSTEILMRSRSLALRFSHMLGQRFSGNGDVLASLHGMNVEANAVSDETDAPDGREIGPTITRMVDWRDPAGESDAMVVQDLAVPGVLRRVFEEATTTMATLAGLTRADDDTHPPQRTDVAAVADSVTRSSMALALIGHDLACGRLQAPGLDVRQDGGPPEQHGDGVLTVHWPEAASDSRIAERHTRLRAQLDASGLGGQLLENPLWSPLPAGLSHLLGEQQGAMLTVHPLGGCPMGDSVQRGVVNDLGRVFDAADSPGDPSGYHVGLYVLDGSIIPTSLGINPALTITRLARRATDRWGIAAWDRADSAAKTLAQPRPPDTRPVFVPVGERWKEAGRAPTLVELTEQMRGKVKLRGRTAWFEVTLTSQATDLRALTRAPDNGGRRNIVIAGGHVRLLAREPRALDDDVDAADVWLEAPILGGKLELFGYEESTPSTRRFKAGKAWLLNRALPEGSEAVARRALAASDAAQQQLTAWWNTVRSGGAGAVDEEDTWAEWFKREAQRLEAHVLDAAWAARYGAIDVSDRARLLWANLSHAGAVRRLDYQLVLGKPSTGLHAMTGLANAFDGLTLRGHKQLTYARESSPVTQLMEMTLPAQGPILAEATLTLNPRYLARVQVPLLRTVGQQDRVLTLLDLASFVLYVARVVMQTHLLSFRAPDPPTDRQPVRACQALDGLSFSEHYIPVRRKYRDRGVDHTLQVRVARYGVPSGPDADAPPVLLIHGYSASSTSFAHPTVDNGLARTLALAGRDVWVADLRTSPALPTATEDWSFEDAAYNDLPRIVAYIMRQTHRRHRQVDIVAHCMGAAMLSMVWLNGSSSRLPRLQRFHRRIGRIVLSQVGPVLQLTEANVLRSYLMRWMRYFLPLQGYRFHVPPGEATGLDNLLDRVLAVLPLSKEEYRRENPTRVDAAGSSWVGSRHRIDALYGRTFELAQMNESTLGHIDDLFGPLSTETVSQVIHFAQQHAVTTRDGRNYHVFAQRVADQTHAPVLSLHGELNGLSHRVTLQRMVQLFIDARLPVINLDPQSPDSLEQVLAPRPPDDHAKALAKAMVQDRWAQQASLFVACLEGMGHQDPLIGKNAGKVSELVCRFLSRRPMPVRVADEASLQRRVPSKIGRLIRRKVKSKKGA